MEAAGSQKLFFNKGILLNAENAKGEKKFLIGVDSEAVLRQVVQMLRLRHGNVTQLTSFRLVRANGEKLKVF